MLISAVGSADPEAVLTMQNHLLEEKVVGAEVNAPVQPDASKENILTTVVIYTCGTNYPPPPPLNLFPGTLSQRCSIALLRSRKTSKASCVRAMTQT